MPNGEGFDDAIDRTEAHSGSWVLGFICRLSAKGPSRRPTSFGGLVERRRAAAGFLRGFCPRLFVAQIHAARSAPRNGGANRSRSGRRHPAYPFGQPSACSFAPGSARSYAGSGGSESNRCRARCRIDMAVFSRALASGRGIQLGILIFLSALARGKIRRRGLRCAGFFHGLAASGHLDTQALCGILSRLGHGVHEIMCHPGFETPALRNRYAWGYKWETEAEALRSAAVKELVERRGIRLRNFAEAWRD